jgi:hypothetical protein
MQCLLTYTYTQHNSVRHSIWMWLRASNSLDRPVLPLCHMLLFPGRNWNHTSCASGEDFQKKKKTTTRQSCYSRGLNCAENCVRTSYQLHVTYLHITHRRQNLDRQVTAIRPSSVSYQSRRKTHLVIARFPKKKWPYELQAILKYFSPRNIQDLKFSSLV